MVLDYIILFIIICVFIILVWILKHFNSNNKGLLHLSEFENKIGQFDTSFRDEFSRNRNELDSKLISFSSMVDTKLSELSDSLLKSSAIEKKSGEIAKTLRAVKTDFGKFADLLDKTRKKINEAGDTLDQIGNRSKQINRKLGKFEELPENVANSILGAENIEE